MSSTIDVVTPGDAGRQAGDAAGHDLTVVLGERDESTLANLREALERGGFSVVAQVRDSVEALNAALEHAPQVCLLDIDLPGGAIAASKRIYAKLPSTRIAMLADSAVEGEVYRAVQAGADGYLLKDTDERSLIAALHAVVRGEPALPRAVTARLVEDARRTLQSDSGSYSRVNRAVFYLPRFAKHLRRRIRSGMPPSMALASTRARMRGYT